MASERLGDMGRVCREVKKWRQLEGPLFQEVCEVEGGETRIQRLFFRWRKSKDAKVLVGRSQLGGRVKIQAGNVAVGNPVSQWGGGRSCPEASLWLRGRGWPPVSCT